MMTIIAYTALAAATILDLLIAMRQDAIALKNNHFSNNRFYAWLRESDELTSPKRLLFLTVLIACCTTMAQMSWIVVMILALVLLAQGIHALLSQRHTPSAIKGRATRLYATASTLALAAVAIAGYLGYRSSEAEASQSTAFVAVMLLTISLLVIMSTNWLTGPIEKRAQNGLDDHNGSD